MKLKFTMAVLFVAWGAAIGYAQKENVPGERSFSSPVVFAKNQGQIEDVSVLYHLKTSSTNLLFGKDKITYQFIEAPDASNTEEPGSADGHVRVQNIAITFANANPSVTIDGTDPLASKTNYFLGSDPSKWATNVPNYKTLRYTNLYNSIDLKYYSFNSKIKYDYIVNPGGTVSDIQMVYDGIQTFELTGDGKLSITSKYASFTEDIPVAYQDINGKRIEVKVAYRVINDHTVGFAAAKYDERYPLIIDPALIYSTFVGGAFNYTYSFNGLIKDNSGNVYVTGGTPGTNYPSTPGSYDVTFNGGSRDVFVFKLDNTASTLLYSTFLGGNNDDYSSTLAIDTATNEVYVTGGAWSSNFPSTPGVYQSVNAGGQADIFVVKLNSTGSALLFSTFVGGSGDNQGHVITLDAAKNIYVAGQTQAGFPTTAGAYDVTQNGDYDGYVIKLNPNATALLYSTFIGGPNRDTYNGIAVDANQNVYLSGNGQAGFPVTTNAVQTTYGGGLYDAVVTKIDPTFSTLLFSTYLGGSGYDAITYAPHVNAAGEVYVGGFADVGFPTVSGSYDVSYNGGTYDCFVAKLNAAGSALIYSTYIGSPGDDWGLGFDVNSNGEAVLTGYCASGFPVTSCAYDMTYNGGVCDAFVSKLDAAGTALLYSSYLGGSGYDKGCGILADMDTVYVVGHTQSNDFPTTSGAYATSYSGPLDNFVLKLATGSTVTAAFSAQNACEGSPVTFTNTSTGGNTYSWDFGDSNTSTSQSPTHTYTAAGTYTITLNVTGSCGTSTATQTITINPSISPTLNISGNTTVCAGQSTTLSVTGASTYQWSGGSTATTANITVSPSVTTTYYVTGSNGGCGSDTDTVTVQVLPTPSVSISGVTSICAGQSTTLTASGASNYQWSGGSSATTSSITISPATTTTYFVTGNNGVCPSQPASVTVQVIPNPVANISGNTVICSGQSTTLTATGGTSYQWSGPVNDTAQSIVVAPTATTTYFVVASNGNCSSPSSSVTVTVAPSPSANISGPPSTCAGGSATLTATGGGTYLWNTGATTGSITVNPTVTTTYSVIVTNSTGCTDTAYFTQTVYQPAFVSAGNDTTICLGDSIQLNGNVISASSYNWSPASTGFGLQPWVSPTVTTSYYLQAYNQFDCYSVDTVVITVVSCTGIKDLEQQVSVSLVPNPANEQVELDVKGDVSPGTTIKIFSAGGKLVLSGMLGDIINRPIDVTAWSAGIYFVTAADDHNTVTMKLAIMH